MTKSVVGGPAAPGTGGARRTAASRVTRRYAPGAWPPGAYGTMGYALEACGTMAYALHPSGGTPRQNESARRRSQ
ncbi:hypothetical protein GCM10019017_31710 [Streptomyces showdoensis]